MSKIFTGEVVSDKMTKTVVVLIKRRMRHPLYKKVITRRKKLYAHNKIGAKKGDLVEVRETRPLSRLKRFEVIKIIKKAGDK